MPTTVALELWAVLPRWVLLRGAEVWCSNSFTSPRSCDDDDPKLSTSLNVLSQLFPPFVLISIFFFFFNSAGAAVSQVFWCGGSAEGHSRLLMCALHIVLEAVVQWWRREFFLCCGATERLWESTQWQQSGSVWIGSFVLFFSFCAILCSDSTRVAPFPYVFSCASMRYDKAVWWEATEGSLLQHHSRIW